MLYLLVQLIPKSCPSFFLNYAVFKLQLNGFVATFITRRRQTKLINSMTLNKVEIDHSGRQNLTSLFNLTA